MVKNGMEAKDARALLSGKVMQGIGQTIEMTPPSDPSFPQINDINAAEALINAALTKIDDVDHFAALLNNFINQLPEKTKTLLNDYSKMLIDS